MAKPKDKGQGADAATLERAESDEQRTALLAEREQQLEAHTRELQEREQRTRELEEQLQKREVELEARKRELEEQVSKTTDAPVAADVVDEKVELRFVGSPRPANLDPDADWDGGEYHGLDRDFTSVDLRPGQSALVSAQMAKRLLEERSAEFELA